MADLIGNGWGKPTAVQDQGTFPIQDEWQTKEGLWRYYGKETVIENLR